jgi:RND family efflux transporter MFP subunit
MNEKQEGPAPRRSTAGVLAVVAIVAVFGALAWRGISGRARAMTELTRDTAEMAVPSVVVVRPKAGAPQEDISLPGAIEPFAEAPIYARTSGYLKRRLVEMGARVKANQLLAEIDAPELEQQLAQAKSDVAIAEANARLAQITADRYLDLVKTDSVSQQDADNASGALDARKATVESARHNVQRLEQLQAFTRIYAPFDGVITARNTDVGALIDPGASGGSARELFHIASTDTLRVFVNVPQAYSRVARPGIPAELTLTEFPGRRFAGTLVRTAEAIDPASRTLLVEVEVANPKGELLPGAFAEVHFKLPAPASMLVLPVNALMFRSEGLQVAVVRGDNRVAMVAVTLGRDFGTEAEILSGLKGDERVVNSPPDSLTDGQTVRVVAAQAAAASGGGSR